MDGWIRALWWTEPESPMCSAQCSLGKDCNQYDLNQITHLLKMNDWSVNKSIDCIVLYCKGHQVKVKLVQSTEPSGGSLTLMTHLPTARIGHYYQTWLQCQMMHMHVRVLNGDIHISAPHHQKVTGWCAPYQLCLDLRSGSHQHISRQHTIAQHFAYIWSGCCIWS